MAEPSVTLFDSSVLLDVLAVDAAWGQWSQEILARAADEGRLVVNPIIYAEISAGFDKIEDLDDALPAGDIEREPLPYEAGLLAGKAFLGHRKRGGRRRSPLPDFSIGAHAAVRGYRLLTCDVPRYRSAFSSLHLPTPTT